MRRRAFLVVLSLGSLAPAACILSIDPLPSPDEPTITTVDAWRSGVDAMPSPFAFEGGIGPADANSDADTSSPTNLLVNGGFEAAPTGTFPCGSPWGTFESTLTSDTTAHTADKACRVCSFTGTAGTTFSINYSPDDAGKMINAGTTLVAQAWARAVPGSSTKPNVGITIRIYDSGNIVDRADCATGSLGDAYGPVDCRFTTTKAGLLNVYLRSEGPGANQCWLVDDFSVAIP